MTIFLTELSQTDRGYKYLLMSDTGPIEVMWYDNQHDQLFVRKEGGTRTYLTPRGVNIDHPPTRDEITHRIQSLINGRALPIGRKRGPRSGRAGSRPRDSQRSKVYRSEDQLPEFKAETIKDIKDIQAMVDKAIASAWWKKRYPHVTFITAKPGKGRRSAAGSSSGRYVKLPLWSRTPLIVLHEIAHVITDRKVAAHGWEYCANYLALVEKFMGKDVARRLKIEFRKNNVKFSAPRKKREMSEEQRAELLERLAKARAVRAAKLAEG